MTPLKSYGDFKFTRGPSCAACDWIEKNQKTKSAYCSKRKVTFPVYEGTREYVCSQFKPLIGKLIKVRSGDFLIEIEEESQ